LEDLEDVVNEFTAAAWAEYGDLTQEVEAIGASLQQVGSRLALDRGEEQGKEGRYNELKEKKAGSEAELAGLSGQLDALEAGYKAGKAAREEEIEELKEEIWDTKAEFVDIHQEIGATNQSITNYQGQILESQQQQAHHQGLVDYHHQRSQRLVTEHWCGGTIRYWVTDYGHVNQRNQHQERVNVLAGLIENLKGNIEELQAVLRELEAKELALG